MKFRKLPEPHRLRFHVPKPKRPSLLKGGILLLLALLPPFLLRLFGHTPAPTGCACGVCGGAVCAPTAGGHFLQLLGVYGAMAAAFLGQVWHRVFRVLSGLPRLPLPRALFLVALLVFIRASTFPQVDLPGPPANPVLVEAGALIIPMDDQKQNLNGKPFNLAAYGLVNHLLQNKIPVYWVIRAGKAKDGVDFSAQAERVLPSAQAQALLDFSGGPFVVPPEFADQALTLATAFGQQVAVYRLKEDRTLDVRYVLTFKPRILIGNDNSNIHKKIYDEAGIPNYTIAANDSALGSNPAQACYTFLSEPHTKTPIQGADLFVQSGGNLMAQCQAALWYENTYHFQINGSMTINNVPYTLQYPNPDLHFSQFTGALEPAPGGSEQDWTISGSFWNNAHPHALSVSGSTTYYAATVSKHVSGPGGLVFYLGGHDYSTSGSLQFYNGRRMLLNAALTPATRPLSCNLIFGALRGYVFLDLNANGVWDPGEPPVPGIQVSYTGPESGTLTTSSLGAYAKGLDLGTYTVSVTVPSWAYVTTGNATQTLTLQPYVMTTAQPVGLAYQVSPVAGQVVINEVLYRQRTGQVDEFVEIYNNGPTSVDLSGFRLMDGNLILGVLDGSGSITGSNTPFTFPAGTVLGPGEYLVVWVGASSPDNTAPGAKYNFYLNQSASKLNDTGDDLWLYDPSLRIVDYVAWGSFPENYYPRTLWDATYQASLAGAGPGQSISLTPNGQDTNTSACWEPTTSGQASSRCPGYLPTVDTDPVPGRVTSVGRNNNGFRVSGQVYHDREPNGMRNGEDWSDGATVYVKLVQGSAVVAVETVNPGSGAYTFTNVAPGTYTLVLDDNANPADTTPTPPSGWLFINPALGSRSVTVTSADVTEQDFGLFHGFRLEGRVFLDDGEGGGDANNAWQDGAERGVPGVVVTATDGTNSRTATTDGLGFYRLYVPYSFGSVTLSHPARPATGWNDGTTAYQVASWAEATAPNSSGATVNLGPASALSGVVVRNFGVVRESRLYPDASGQTGSPGAISYAHFLKPGTLGSYTLSLANAPRFAYQVRRDVNCDGDFDDPGEGFQGLPLTFTVDATWPREADGSLKACGLEVRVLVPAGEPDGSLDIALLSGALSYANNPGVVETRSLTDTTTVSTGQVRLEKRVRNVTQGTAFGASASGKPGEVLEYCIAFRNLGTAAVTGFVLTDPIPFFTDLWPYGPSQDIKLTFGTTTYLTAAPGDDQGEVVGGVVRVALGTLGPGAYGEVCYQARIR